MKNLRLTGERLVTGPGALNALGELSFTRAMVVTGGHSMFRNGTIDRVKALLAPKGAVEVYGGVGANPTRAEVEKGLDAMRAFRPDLVVAVGGGSAIDAAKAMLLFYEWPSLNFDNVFQTPLPQKRTHTAFAAVPSTSGTASEVTHVTVVTFPALHQKLAIKTEALRPDIAILDGEICLSLPAHIAAETGMDALTHAIECFTNRSKDTFTDLLAKGAVEGIFDWLPRSVRTGDLESRQRMHEYSCMAGMAFSNAGLGMVHGISHAFSARYNTAHGLANAVILPFVLDYNRRDPWVAAQLDRLSAALGGDAVERVRALSAAVGIPSCLKETGIAEEDFRRDETALIEGSLLGSTAVNPVPMTADTIAPIVRAAYFGG
ncbi:MAG: iron-containing alcohol dehydrogenase [Eubacteriales bacterium]|nr:iron-containing alcohol dehydrogenase [Eubacteriales bacterium]